MKIQRIKEHHIQGIVYLCRLCMPDEGFTDPQLFLSWFPNNALGFCVRTRKKREIMAFLFGVRLPSAYYIMCIGVHPKFARQGWGKKLVESLCCSVPSGMSVWCKIHRKNEASLRFFKRLGFRKEAKKNTPKGLKKSFRTSYDPYRFDIKHFIAIDNFDFLLESQTLSDRIRKLNG